MVRDILLIENFELLFENDIVLYGAGKKGLEINEKLKGIGISVSAFCDSDSMLWGNKKEDITVISPNELLELSAKKENIIIIVSTVNYYSEIINNLENQGFRCLIFTTWGLDYSILANIEHERVPPFFREKYKYYYKINKEIYLHKWKARIIEYTLESMKEIENQKDVIWIYQAGKVASTAIAESIKKCGIDVQHIQSLKYCHYLLGNELFNEWNVYLDKIRKRGMKIITAVREPIARNYALFWQLASLDRFKYRPIMSNNWQQLYDKVIRSDDIEKGSYYCDMIKRNQFNWFDDEIKSILGVDIYSYPFNKDKGYQVIKQGNIEILVLKFESLSYNTNIISEFIGCKDFSLERANDSKDKIIKYAYDEFKDIVRIDKSYIDNYYNSSHFNHFYTEEEKNQFLERWKNNIVE